MARFGAKTSLYLLTSTSLAAIAYQSLSTSPTLDSPSNFLNGAVRSSRAIFNIASCVVDYKYSLHRLPADSDGYGSTLSEIHLRSAKRILRLCEANKGFYVKAGQFVAAMRQVPKEYSSILSSLQDQAVPCNFKAIREVIRKSLGKDLSEIFSSFDEKPVAAASIAQVHHAILKGHGEVAVKVIVSCDSTYSAIVCFQSKPVYYLQCTLKPSSDVLFAIVQYPGLEYMMKYDLATMAFLSRSVEWLFPEYRFSWLVSEFDKSITSELDFIQEAENSERAANNFKRNSLVKIPHIYWDFTSSKVLTMEFCEGRKIDDMEYLKHKGINPLEVAKVLVEVFAEMIFVHGFLHGDPHPGNILVCPRGHNKFTLVLLDHGIYKQLDEDFRQNYCQLWEALTLPDSQKIEELGKTFGVEKYSRYFPVIFTGRTINSKSMLGKGMSPEEKQDLKEEVKLLKMEDISSFMESLPTDFLTILRTDGLLRSLTSKLGAPQRIRLLAYAKCALRGISSEANCKSDSGIFPLARLKTSIKYVRLRFRLDIMEFVAYLDDIRGSLNTRFIRLISLAGDFIWNLRRILLLNL